MFAVLSVSDWEKVGVCRRMFFGWLEALCQHLHHLHSKTKQGSLRCAPCMKCAPCQKTQHRAFRNCHLIKFFRCRFWSLSRDIEKYLGQFVQPTPSQMISWERLTHVYVKPWTPPPPFFFFLQWYFPGLTAYKEQLKSCLKSIQHPAEGSAALRHHLDQVGKPEPLRRITSVEKLFSCNHFTKLMADSSTTFTFILFLYLVRICHGRQ